MKKIEIFGKKVPVIAILIALLVIGTASAAVFLNYATLSGTVDVSNGISVTDSDGDIFEANGEGVLNFESPAVFTINNANNEPAIVNLVTTLTLDTVPVDDFAGLTVDYSVIDGTGVEATDPGTLVLVPPGGLTVDVEFDAADDAMPGEYEVIVAVEYSAEDYEDFEGENAMETLLLTHKEGFGPSGSWTPIGEISTLEFIQMGNEFYYELDATDLESEVEYALIYYADQEDPFANWGGVAPGVIDTFTTGTDGNAIVVNCINLNMNMPSPDDINYPVAKIWIVPTDVLTDGTCLPINPEGGWQPTRFLFEYDDLTYYIDTNIA